MIEKKTTREIKYKWNHLCKKKDSLQHNTAGLPYYKRKNQLDEFEKKEWVSKESLVALTKLDGLSYITKERLLKELGVLE